MNDPYPADAIFEAVARGLETSGWVVLARALPEDLCRALGERAEETRGAFRRARVGRDRERLERPDVRQDEIRWLDDDDPAERAWLEWMEALKESLNRCLYLGLFRFESHFSRYAPGACYRRHRDSFRGAANRVLSTVAYLNADWDAGAGGELVLYEAAADHDGARELVRVRPEIGTLVVFLSELFPHEVLPATRPRLAVTGWFRRNDGSGAGSNPRA